MQQELSILFSKYRAEREKLEVQLGYKEKELERTRSEIGSLKNLMETKVVNFEVEKRYFFREFSSFRNHLKYAKATVVVKTSSFCRKLASGASFMHL